MRRLLPALAALGLIVSARAALPFDADKVQAAFGPIEGGLVVMDVGSGEVFKFNPPVAAQPLPPCSTFKIWNSLIGLEEGIIKDPDAPFWKWDGEARFLLTWNQDQTWRTAFKASCVPAFQDLARRIGPKRMQSWLNRLGYGNQDMAGRPDAFWLPRGGEKTILITAEGETALMAKLLRGELPVAPSSLARLKDVMKLETTSRGTLYGKTGSGLRQADGEVDYDLGWLSGFLEHEGKTYAYSCVVLGPGLYSPDARRIAEAMFRESGML
jgi:beta-lactamase class D